MFEFIKKFKGDKYLEDQFSVDKLIDEEKLRPYFNELLIYLQTLNYVECFNVYASHALNTYLAVTKFKEELISKGYKVEHIKASCSHLNTPHFIISWS